MKITQNDINETIELSDLMVKIDRMDPEYVTMLSDEIFKQQPFFLTVLIGYRLDVKPAELEEIMKLYFLIWEYFRSNKNVQTKKITEADFEKVQDRNIEMLRHLQCEEYQSDKLNVFLNDLGNMKSKSLLASVHFRYKTIPTLMKMNEESKGIIFIGIKCFIECFETTCKKSRIA